MHHVYVPLFRMFSHDSHVDLGISFKSEFFQGTYFILKLNLAIKWCELTFYKRSCTKIIIKMTYSHMHYLRKTSVLIWNFLGSISLCIINVYHFTTICILEVENKLLAQMYLCHYTRSAEAVNKSTPNSHI